MSIVSERFYSHLEHIYDIFGNSSSNESSEFHSIDAFVIVRGKFNEEDKESTQMKTSILHDYIFNYDLTDTLIFFSPKKIYFFVMLGTIERGLPKIYVKHWKIKAYPYGLVRKT